MRCARWRLRTGTIVAVLAALLWVVLPVGIASAHIAATGPSGTGTPTETGPFAGILPSGEGAKDCFASVSRDKNELTYECKFLKRNFLGSYVLLHFPSKNFDVHLRLAANSVDSRHGVNWYEQNSAVPLPYVWKFGTIRGRNTVDVNGKNVPNDPMWDLGLDKTFGTYIGQPETVDVIATITLIKG